MSVLNSWVPAVLLLLGFTVIVVGQNVLPDYRDHPCIRECADRATPRTCVYNFTVESYYVLSDACMKCPHNYTDCFRPQCVAADGVSRAIMTVNRMLPGPAIVVCLDDMVIVNVHNKLEGGVGTTIHWHGVFHEGSQHHDGAPMITQCPIPQYSIFEYRFKAGNRGTHYWHAHMGTQRDDGIFGAFIIREPKSRDPSSTLYENDLQEHVLIVTDWMHEMTSATVSGILLARHRMQSPDLLINGRGAFKEFIDPSTNLTIHTPYSLFQVKKDQKYRFRVISNGIMSCPIQISVDSHELTLIASDGVPFEPVVLSSFNIYPGERYDFVLDADKAVGNYWIRARGLLECAKLSAKQVAILRYDEAPQEQPAQATDYDSAKRDGKSLGPMNKKATTDMMSVSWLNSTQADSANLKQVPDKTFLLSMDFFFINNFPNAPDGAMPYLPLMNRITNMLPPSPLLTQFEDIPKDLFCGARHNLSHCKSQEFCSCIYLLKIDLGDTVEIVFINDGKFRFEVVHPMHLHGQNFRVIAMDKDPFPVRSSRYDSRKLMVHVYVTTLTIITSYYRIVKPGITAGHIGETTSLEEFKTLDASGMVHRNLDTPVVKDTVTVSQGGYTIIRFLADIPDFSDHYPSSLIAIGMDRCRAVLSKSQKAAEEGAEYAFEYCEGFTSFTRLAKYDASLVNMKGDAEHAFCIAGETHRHSSSGMVWKDRPFQNFQLESLERTIFPNHSRAGIAVCFSCVQFLELALSRDYSQPIRYERDSSGWDFRPDAPTPKKLPPVWALALYGGGREAYHPAKLPYQCTWAGHPSYE